MRRKRCSVAVMLGGACLTAAVCGAGAAEKGPAMEWVRTDRSVALKRGGAVLWQYNHGKDEPKPHFHPLCLPDGTVLTALRPKDHVWHYAGWFSWKYVNGVLYWEPDRKTAKSPGRTEVVDVKVAAADDFSAKLELSVSYHPWGKPAVLTEKRLIRVSAPAADGGYTIDWTGTFTAGATDVVLDRTPLAGQPGGKPWGGYAGLSLRMSAATRGWTYLDSEGRTYNTKMGKQAKIQHGRAARWLDYSGPTKAGGSGGAAMFDHPSNLRHPSKWFVDAGMPYFGPAVIFDSPHTIPAGKSLTLTYRIVIHPHAARRDRIEKQWKLWAAGSGPYQATGLKVGEVTDTTAIVWTRLTRKPERNPSDAPMVKFEFEKPPDGRSGSRRRKVRAIVYPEGMTVADIRDAAPGAAGEVRVSYRPEAQRQWSQTPWGAVDAERDFTRQVKLTGLKPATAYALRVECRPAPGRPGGQTVEGRFRTAPPPDKPAKVVFTVSTGQGYGSRDLGGRGYKIYPQMLKLDPDFFVHTGDIVYYDKLAKSPALARYHWQRTYSLPTNVEFHRQVASYFIKDDHDTWQNDCWPTMRRQTMGSFTFAQGVAIFPEQVPMGPKTYRTYRWGRDLQIWLVEGRDFRSANTDPDGPGKTIWGAEQKAWFKRTVKQSDATFRLLISPTPLVGPDRTNKNDNHANKGFTHEGDELRRFIAARKNMAVVCGDRHWQYVSVHSGTGVREYSCGPVSDKHAGGWSNDKRTAAHKYLNVVGGFLAGVVERTGGKAALTFRHYGVDGKVLNEDRLEAAQ